MDERRVAWSMTIDPDGAMHDWVDLPAGCSLIRVPTQEAVTLVGVRAYQEAVVDLCASERVHLLVTHPPYDYLDGATAARLSDGGTALVGYAFDDKIIASQYGAATRAALAAAYVRYVTTEDVPWATRPQAALPERAAEHDVVLVGRCYARRRELVAALRNAGLDVVVRGWGWPEGAVSRREMLDLYARSAVVLTTADWEDRPLAMVKHRLLDTAALGAFQIAEQAPDLDRYFPSSEVPRYRAAEDLVAAVRQALADPAGRRAAAAAARARSVDQHTWSRRFAALIDGVPLREPDAAGPRSRLFDQLLLALASRAEAQGRIGAAAALWGEAAARRPDDPAAVGGLGRCQRDLGDLEEAIGALRRAAAASAPICAAAVYCGIPPAGGGTGLGRLALFPPSAEPTLLLIAALIEAGRVAEAVATLDGITDPSLATAVAATLTGEMPEEVRASLDRLRA